MLVQSVDVVVIGSGIAGVSAAIEAARAGARVALASLGATFSGSSFYDAFGLRPEDEVRVALYAHASNGGIRIASDTSCVGGPAGLFACGECAGGMHGADRLGGLASASALVFGRIAGAQAARAAGCESAAATNCARELLATPHAPELRRQLQAAMTTHAMVNRTGDGLGLIAQQLADLSHQMRETSVPTDAPSKAVETQRLVHQLVSAAAMVQAMRDRIESCGSHHRADSAGGTAAD